MLKSDIKSCVCRVVMSINRNILIDETRQLAEVNTLHKTGSGSPRQDARAKAHGRARGISRRPDVYFGARRRRRGRAT